MTSLVCLTKRLKIQDHSRQPSFVVLEHDEHEILLANDWLKLNGASLHPSDLVLKFSGT